MASIATVGADAEAAAPSLSAKLARAASGQFFAVGTYSTGEVSVFDSAGRLVNRFGRAGRGPGEFGSTDDVRIQSDTVFVYDDQLRRIQAFHTDGKYIGMALQMPHFSFFTPRSSGGIVVTGNPESTEDIRIETRNISGLLSSFTFRNEKSQGEENGYALVVDDGGEAVWVTDGKRYLIEKRSYSGGLLKRLRLSLDWFPPLPDVMSNPTAYVAKSVIVAIALPASNYLAVLIYRYPTTRPPMESHQLSEKQMAVAARNFTRPILHVVDTRSGQLVSELNNEAYFIGFADNQHIYASRLLQDGTAVLDVFRIVLKNPNTEEGCS